MSRFLSAAFAGLEPYVPGEQPQNQQYIKLNTNESPYPPAPEVVRLLNSADAAILRLYSDPESRELCREIAGVYGKETANVFVGNGSDEVLAFAFQAYGKGKPMAFPDITYGFYKVFAALYDIKTRIVPLDEDFAIRTEEYLQPGENVVIANPNALTGKNLPLADIEKILQAHPDDVVIVDEAYVDFGGESAAALLDRYDNLLVVQTFSKSRQLAGARVGLALAQPGLIADLNTIKFSFNPYNVNRLSCELAAAAMRDRAYFDECRGKIIADRAYTTEGLQKMGFEVLPSLANFVLAGHPRLAGGRYYQALKERGILVRWFDEERIRDFVRITIGTHDEMQQLLAATGEILQEEGSDGHA